MVLIEGADATRHYLQTALELVAVQVDEVANVGEVVGRDGAEELTVVVVLVVAMDTATVEPGEVIDYFQNRVV